MTANHLAIVATVILLFPMLYFLLASPGFLLIKLDIPPVTQLLRSLFSSYFLIMTIVGVVVTIAFVVAGRPLFALCVAAIAALAVWGRRWFLNHIDAELSARDAGDASAVRRLRHLHLSGMAFNAVQFAAVVASVPFVVPPI